MQTICPKCGGERQPTDVAPDWQCPACGVAYIKAAQYAAGVKGSQFSPSYGARSSADGGVEVPWAKLILAGLIAWAAWTGFNSNPFDGSDSVTEGEIATLASTVRSGDVLMYTTTQCPYCAQARSWLNQYGFTFSECDTEVREDCAREYQALGATGVPYLIVKGHHMKDGFDSDEFIAALR